MAEPENFFSNTGVSFFRLCGLWSKCFLFHKLFNLLKALSLSRFWIEFLRFSFNDTGNWRNSPFWVLLSSRNKTRNNITERTQLKALLQITARFVKFNFINFL